MRLPAVGVPEVLQQNYSVVLVTSQGLSVRCTTRLCTVACSLGINQSTGQCLLRPIGSILLSGWANGTRSRLVYAVKPN